MAEADANGWRPIETAPKDGARVLVACLKNGRAQICVAWWHPAFAWADGADVAAWTDGTVADWRGEELAELSPTHWMPLPAMPGGPTP